MVLTLYHHYILRFCSMILDLHTSSSSRLLRRMLATAALLALCLVVAGGWPGASAVAPQAGSAEPGLFECRWTDLPVRIDARADDAAWKAAQVIDRFALPWAGKTASTATKARLLWDRENLY